MKYVPSFILGAVSASLLGISLLGPSVEELDMLRMLVTVAVDDQIQEPDLGPLEFDYDREPEDYFFGWETVKLTDDATGLFSELNTEEAVIFLRANEGNDSTGLHEVGHWYDYTQGMISLTPEFRQAIDEYLAMENVEWPELQEQIRNDYLLPEEIFADLYRLMLVSPDRIPDVFRVFFHDTFYARVNPDWRVSE